MSVYLVPTNSGTDKTHYCYAARGQPIPLLIPIWWLCTIYILLPVV